MDRVSEHPLVSIVTVTKNCVATIGDTLASVQAIKSPDVEYIIIDGVSRDGTLSVIEQQGSVVDKLISEPDTGIYNAMNKGIAAAAGQYLLFLNGDDRLVADGFSRAKAILAAERPDILSCCSNVYLADGTPGGVLSPSSWLLPFFNSIPHPSTFVLSALQKKFRFREDLRIASDYDLFLKLFMQRHRFRLERTVVATHSRGGASSDVSKSMAEIKRIKKENLGVCLYGVVRVIEVLNRTRKRVAAIVGIRGNASVP